MFVHAYDAEKLILVMLYPRGGSTDVDFEASVRAIERLGADVAARPGNVASMLVLAEHDEPPGPSYRQRIAEIEQHIPLLNMSLIATSRANLVIMAVFNWLSPQRTGFVRTVHQTYDLARDWHVKRGVHPASAFDRLYQEVRRYYPSAPSKAPSGVHRTA